MRILDTLCAATLFVLAIVCSLLIPRTYTGRIWIFGTDLALMFVAMLNLLRIRTQSTRDVRLFCIAANIAMLALCIALMASIGRSRTWANFEIPVTAALLLVEMCFSLRKPA
jgi:phosphatidylserine synthase